MAEFDQLLDAVQRLNATVITNTEATNNLGARVNAAEATSRRHKVAIIVSAVGLIADLLLSGVFITQHYRQNCVNDRSQAFYRAEYAKVSGQVQGLNLMTTGTQAAARKGFEQFRTASESYLVGIKDLQKKYHC